MNIFILDKDINRCAKYHCDKHVVKMILEYAQILCTVCNLYNVKAPYRSTHVKHPCVLWAAKSIRNFRWLRELARALNEEYKFRYDKTDDHSSYKVIKTLKEPKLPDIGLTEHPQAMPKKYQVPNNPVKAYRNFYIYMKRPFATWTKRRIPSWYKKETSSK